MNGFTMRPRTKLKKCLETNENELKTAPNLWDRRKAVLKGNFIAINAYQKIKKSQITYLYI